MAIVEKLEQQLDLPKKVRMHWTGCPNSCGQVCERLNSMFYMDLMASPPCHRPTSAAVDQPTSLFALVVALSGSIACDCR